MTPKRPYRLNFIGTVLPDGRPERYLEFMPVDENGTPRNLTAEETDALDQDQLKAIRDSGLYSEVSEPKKASTSRPKAATAAKPAEPAPEPDTAAGPATESEG
jgi:hypothetical protein